MSTTPYKDELIRIAALLGLPDETDPTEVAQAVQAALDKARTDSAALEQAERRVEAEQTIRLQNERDRNTYRDATRQAAVKLEWLGEQLTQRKDRAKSPQAYADMTELATIAQAEAANANRVLNAAP